MKLTKQQLEVLRLLMDHPSCPTTTSTFTSYSKQYVAGTTAAALRRRGLVEYTSVRGNFEARITDKGREALARHLAADRGGLETA